MKAIWKGAVIAESEDIVMVEGNAYFPADAVCQQYLQPSNHRTHCAWKGEARYHSLLVDGELNRDAVWFYPEPKPEAESVRDRMTFWRGVQVSP
jgi:uncharacterized protein (DUF427 family)